MLNRRYLRIKVMQALYAFFQEEENDLPRGERELLRSIDKAYELYIYLLLLPAELVRIAQNKIGIGREKRLPTPADLNPNMRFVQNKIVQQLADHPQLQKEGNARKLTWQTDDEQDMLRKLWENVSNSAEYRTYMSAPSVSYMDEQEFILDIFRKFVADDDDMEHFLEERNMHWPGDLNMAVAPSFIRTIESGSESKAPLLAPLYKDPEDDRQFVLDLFRKTVLHNERSQQLISEKTVNWEVERIAVMDVILMKMAITELLEFKSVPVKVTLNEYIEISKTYSTPKSKQFINGILDKLVADFRKDNAIQKTGRGLIE